MRELRNGGIDAADTQAGWYARARWYVSLPESDSVSVSVLEALAHGCIPLLSDLPANRELVHPGDDGQMPGWVARGDSLPGPADLQPLLAPWDPEGWQLIPAAGGDASRQLSLL